MHINSLQKRLCLYVISAVIATFFAVATVVYCHNRTAERESAVTLANLQLQSILYGIDKDLFEVEKETAMAVSDVRSNIASPDSLMDIAARLVTSNDHIMGSCVAFEPDFYPQYGPFMEYVSLDSAGTVRQKHLGHATGYDYTSMEWYTSVRDSGGSRWSEPYFDEGGGNRMMTTFTIPIFADNRFAGVVTADIALDDFMGRIETLKPYPDSYTVVASGIGTIISHPDTSAILKQSLMQRADIIGSRQLAGIVQSAIEGRSGTVQLNIGGIDKFVCYSPLGRTGWTVMYISPYRNILDTLGNSLLWILSVLLIALVVLGLAVQRIIRSTTRPIEKLTEAAYKISEGDFNATLPSIRHNDEIGRLRDAFAHMQRSLSDYIVQLTDTTREKQRIESELSIARQIQLNLVPRTFSPFAECEGLELFAVLNPAKEVGGDFYDFFFKDDKLVFAIGDVSGKGVPAALVMSVTRTLFRVYGGKCDTAAEVLTGINEVISTDNEAYMFVTLFVGIFNPNDGSLDYCNAGHDYPMIVAPGNVHLLESDSNIPVGVVPDYRFDGFQHKMTAGETLLLYTDGVVEAVNSDNEQFGEIRLAEIAGKHADATPSRLLGIILDRLKAFENTGSQFDDITLMAFTQTSKPSAAGSSLVITNSLNELSKIAPFLEAFAGENSLDSSTLFNLNLIIEETLVNTVSYGYRDRRADSIHVTVSADSESVKIMIIDSADPFNPLESKAADTDTPLCKRDVGGLGIHLIRQLSSEMAYEYTGHKNILTLKIAKTSISHS